MERLLRPPYSPVGAEGASASFDMRTRTITTLDDFVGVPEEELYNCLAAFARAIREAKAAKALLASGGNEPPSLVKFVWKPRPPSDKLSGGRAAPETPIVELGFNYETRAALLQARILCLADFSELSRSDFWKMPGVGRGTIARVQDWLLHNKRLQHTVRVAASNPGLANLLLEQFGGPQGEFAAACRYFTQAVSEKDPGRKLFDIATEELSHLEIIGSIVAMLKVRRGNSPRRSTRRQSFIAR